MHAGISRRQWLAGAAGAACVSPSRLFAADPKRETIAYKQVDQLNIFADVYRARGAKPRPALVWIHGGALINGHREGISGRVRKFAAESNYVLVSLDYRLAPETKLPEIIKDIEDAFAWLHREGPKKFGVDATRVGVAGGSAGGYLTLTSGFRARPKPTVLLSLWGYGDLIGDWYSKPSPHPRHHRSKLSRAEAYQQVQGSPISDSRRRKGNGGAFYQYCRQTGEWPKAVSGWDPRTESEKFKPYMPSVNVTPDYPPTVMIHGDRDTDVPFEQSKIMERAFSKHGVAHELHRIKNGEHGLPGGDPKAIEQAYAAAFAFVRKRLG